MTSYTSIHNHSEYSIVDGMSRIGDLVAKAKEQGHSALALTDHLNMHGAVEFYLACKDAGIHPVLGCEVLHEPFLAADGKQQEVVQSVVLAKSNAGLELLMWLVSQAWENNKIIPQTALGAQKQWGELVWISSFNVGESDRLSQREPKDQQLFSERTRHLDLYFEISDHNLPSDAAKRERIVQLAAALSVPLVASCNSHYLMPEDKQAAEIHICLKNELKLQDIRNRWGSYQAHFMSNEEFAQKFGAYGEAVANTTVIAQKCEVSLDFSTYHLPKIETEEKTAVEILKEETWNGFDHRFPDIEGERLASYKARLEHELKVIIEMGFADYFLIVSDFIQWSKTQGIPVGPGRGSGAGSLVAYCLKITDLDPIPYNLIFERFLNPERVSMPDFDIDFCQERRDEVIQYVTDKYGAQQVAQIVTFGKLQARAVIRDVGRVLGMGYNKVDGIAKLVPPEIGIKLKQAIAAEPQFNELAAQDDGVADLLRFAQKLEGLTRHSSVHAAGVVIADKPLWHYVPLMTDENGNKVTQFEMKKAEQIGLIKFDFLGLKTLTVIQKTIDLVQKVRGITINIETIDMTDQTVFQLITKGISVGVFQLESDGMKQLLKKLQPSSFEDIIALVALFRPGPLQSGMVDDFIERKHGRKQITYALPQLEPILQDTYGTILYQEQVQKIAAILASYSLGEADLLRRAMGKKKPEEMAKQKSRFIEGCTANGIETRIAEDTFDAMAKFAEYGFNKSHSAAYGLVSYQTAYLKTHFTPEFFAASMTCDMDNADKMARYIEDCRVLHIAVKPPHVNLSEQAFSVSEGAILYPLCAIKGLSDSASDYLIRVRESQGAFTSLLDFIQKIDLHELGKKNFELLALAGCFDTWGYARDELFEGAAYLLNLSVGMHKDHASDQMLLFDTQETSLSEEEITASLVKKDRIRFLEMLEKEKELLHAYVSAHPMDLYQADQKKFSKVNLKSLEQKRDPKEDLQGVFWLAGIRQRMTRKNKPMAILNFQDQWGEMHPAIFDVKADFYEKVLPKQAYFVKFRIRDDERRSFQILEITPIEAKRKESVKQIVLHLDANKIKKKNLFHPSAQEGVPLLLKLHYPEGTVSLRSEQKIFPDDRSVEALYGEWAALQPEGQYLMEYG